MASDVPPLAIPPPDVPLGPLDESFKWFLANMAFSSTPQQVKEFFSTFGTVNFVKIIYDNRTRNSKGYGFLYMNDAQGDAEVERFARTHENRIKLGGKSRVLLQRHDHKRVQPVRNPKAVGHEARSGRYDYARQHSGGGEQYGPSEPGRGGDYGRPPYHRSHSGGYDQAPPQRGGPQATYNGGCNYSQQPYGDTGGGYPSQQQAAYNATDQQQQYSGAGYNQQGGAGYNQQGYSQQGPGGYSQQSYSDGGYSQQSYNEGGYRQSSSQLYDHNYVQQPYQDGSYAPTPQDYYSGQSQEQYAGGYAGPSQPPNMQQHQQGYSQNGGQHYPSQTANGGPRDNVGASQPPNMQRYPSSSYSHTSSGPSEGPSPTKQPYPQSSSYSSAPSPNNMQQRYPLPRRGSSGEIPPLTRGRGRGGSGTYNNNRDRRRDKPY